jgi:hypothetical protein
MSEKLMSQIRDYRRLVERGKKAYQQADELFAEFLPKLSGSVFEVDGVRLQLVDNFAEKNIAFRPCGVKRFELKEVRG